jgi:ornithine carbamoyltransferase
MKNLLKMMDLTANEIVDILNMADRLKYEKKNSIRHHHLKGKTLGMIFKKPSTRTRISFEVGMYELGGTALFLNTNDLQLGRGEPVEDTARVLSRYLDGIMIRTFNQQEVEQLAAYSSIPVINGLTDYSHPCQVLADLMTIREYKGSFDGLKLCYIGSGNNMANSLIVGGIKTGMKVSVACPAGCEPDKKIMQWAKEHGDFTLTENSYDAAQDADVVCTDTWVSMGQEEDTDSLTEKLRKYQVNNDLMAVADKEAIVLHCLPAYREREITAKVFEEHAGEIFDEAENRLHVQKAVLVKCLSDKLI